MPDGVNILLSLTYFLSAEKERPNLQYTADIPPPDNGQSPGKIYSIRPLSKT
jgi:hypothetical protein